MTACARYAVMSKSASNGMIFHPKLPSFESTRLRRVFYSGDGFEQALRNLLVNAFGEGPCASWTKVSFCSVQGKELCVLKVMAATEQMYPKEKGVEDPILYVRLGNTTTPMSGRQAVAYFRERWGWVSMRRSYSRRPAVQPAA